MYGNRLLLAFTTSLTISYVLAAISEPTCYTDDVTKTQTCYRYFSRDRVTWDQAQTRCKEHGGSLANIHSDGANNVVAAEIAKSNKVSGDKGYTYIGCVRNVTLGAFLWNDGSVLTVYQRWIQGAPFSGANKQGVQKNCCAIPSKSTMWTNVGCAYEADMTGFVCQLHNHKSNFFNVALENYRMIGPGRGNVAQKGLSMIECADACVDQVGCAGFNVCVTGGIKWCEVVTTAGWLEMTKACQYYQISY